MKLTEKLQKAYDSVKSHETVTVELDWFEVSRLLAMEKANETYDRSITESLLGTMKNEKTEIEKERIILYISEYDYRNFNLKDVIFASEVRFFDDDRKFIIDKSDIKYSHDDEHYKCKLYVLKDSSSIQWIND